MKNTEVQKAVDAFANSVDEEELGRILTKQIIGFRHDHTCPDCGAGPFKNASGLSVHWRKHMPTELPR